MTHDIIQGDAIISWVTGFCFAPFIASLVVDTCRDSTVFDDEGIHDIVEFESRYPRLHIVPYHIKDRRCELTRLADSLDLFGSFDNDFSHGKTV